MAPVVSNNQGAASKEAAPLFLRQYAWCIRICADVRSADWNRVYRDDLALPCAQSPHWLTRSLSLPVLTPVVIARADSTPILKAAAFKVRIRTLST